jgi:hypothetical protein
MARDVAAHRQRNIQSAVRDALHVPVTEDALLHAPALFISCLDTCDVLNASLTLLAGDLRTLLKPLRNLSLRNRWAVLLRKRLGLTLEFAKSSA